MTAYLALCLHPACDFHHAGHGFNAAAERHTRDGHATTTCVAGGPMERRLSC